MNSNANDLVKKSLEIENDFSSLSHTVDTLAKELEPIITEYEIPSRYNRDTLRIILVNTEKYYVYWEFSDNTIKKNSIKLNNDKIYFKVNDVKGNEIYHFDSSFALGDYYIKSKFENMDIYVKAGVFINGEFKELISSNVIHTFSSQVNFPDEQDEVWLRKKLAWTEVINSTMTYFAEDNVQKVSSSSLIKE